MISKIKVDGWVFKEGAIIFAWEAKRKQKLKQEVLAESSESSRPHVNEEGPHFMCLSEFKKINCIFRCSGSQLQLCIRITGGALNNGDEGTTQINSEWPEWVSVTGILNKFAQVTQIMSLGLRTTFPSNQLHDTLFALSQGDHYFGRRIRNGAVLYMYPWKETIRKTQINLENKERN